MGAARRGLNETEYSLEAFAVHEDGEKDAAKEEGGRSEDEVCDLTPPRCNRLALPSAVGKEPIVQNANANALNEVLAQVLQHYFCSRSLL